MKATLEGFFLSSPSFILMISWVANLFTGENMNQKTWGKIKYYRDKYRNSINGWALANLIGDGYDSESRRSSSAKRKRLGKRKSKTT